MHENASNTYNQSANRLYISNDSAVFSIQISVSILSIILAVLYMVLVSTRPLFRKNKLNWFTVNVCLTSVFLCSIILQISIQQLLTVSSGLSCRLQAYLADMAACQMMYSHCVVAISRIFTIVYSNKQFFRSNSYIWLCIGLGWAFALLIALPQLFSNSFTCPGDEQPEFMPYYTLVTTLLLPVAIVSLCNIRIFLFVRQSTRRVGVTGGSGQNSHSRDVFLLKTTIGTFVAFLIGWTPLLAIQLFNKNNLIPSFLNACIQVLPSITILYDVIVIIYTNQPVRNFIKQIIMRHP
ncbi:unnamed protein product [Adineta ricciae]|uniref:G-protein coupled receptors family 1 profile domain-containing protein n=1 Tax=Adineta ricciae TaxID=249248 RepID=A0A813QJ61_ADIRI|nr:unnamed protein product [Adineta ricciae]CAF1283774.1 unnamed protein product [Adineta ricciae]